MKESELNNLTLKITRLFAALKTSALRSHKLVVKVTDVLPIAKCIRR